MRYWSIPNIREISHNKTEWNLFCTKNKVLESITFTSFMCPLKQERKENLLCAVLPWARPHNSKKQSKAALISTITLWNLFRKDVSSCRIKEGILSLYNVSPKRYRRSLKFRCIKTRESVYRQIERLRFFLSVGETSCFLCVISYTDEEKEVRYGYNRQKVHHYNACFVGSDLICSCRYGVPAE